MIRLFSQKTFFYILIEIPIIILLAKTYFINTVFINEDSTLLYRLFQTISHDIIIYFFILLFTYISYQKFTHYIFGVFLRLLSLTLFLIYLVDIYILNNFATHLVLNDVIKYISYAPKYLDQLYELNLLLLIFIFLFVLFCSYFILKDFKIKNRKTQYVFVFVLMLFLLINQFSQNGRYIHSWLYKNFVEYNIEIYDQSKAYSEEFIKNIKHEVKLDCQDNKIGNENVIILMVESLSSYQSDYFSKIKDWTPNLDKLAKENISFTDFYANGFVTEDAEVAMITGELPIYAPKAYSDGGGVSFDGFYNIKDSLPYLLKEQNYHSEFITSSDLEFSKTGIWAKSNGFNYVEGSEHQDYNNKQRFHFKAAADEYLYKRVLNRIDKQNSKYFMFIKTVSSHAPFINPENLSNSEEETIKYVDKQIGIFYKELERRNFFKNGILIILGDHHPIIPVKDEEIKKFGGVKAPSITPMIIVHKNKQKVIKESFSQTDIYNSLKNHFSSKSCTSIWSGELLSTNIKAPKYVLHRRGDQRGIVSVFSKKGDFDIKLFGDKTKVINDKQNTEVVNKINYIRIKRLKKEYKEQTN